MDQAWLTTGLQDLFGWYCDERGQLREEQVIFIHSHLLATVLRISILYCECALYATELLLLLTYPALQ